MRVRNDPGEPFLLGPEKPPPIAGVWRARRPPSSTRSVSTRLEIYVAEGPPEAQGFKQVLMGPAHPPYERFLTAPGHQMGFNDLKIIEAHGPRIASNSSGPR